MTRLQTVLLAILLLLISFSIWLYKSSNMRDGSRNGGKREKIIIVSIQPLKKIAEQIVSDKYVIHVLVPPGSSPETYEPTPEQIVNLSKAEYFFSFGLLDFEHEIERRLNGTAIKIVNLSEGIKLLEGSCSHNHGAGNGHHHSIDPHVWLAPLKLKQIANSMFSSLPSDFQNQNIDRYLELQNTLTQLDKTVRDRLSNTNVKSFLIYHPSLTYYAADYSLEQIAIEYEGKEPSAEHMYNIINQAKRRGFRGILLQQEFSSSVVQAISKELKIEVAYIDPLAVDLQKSLVLITDVIIDYGGK